MTDIDVHELKQKLDAKEDFVFIDVREEHEYAEFNLGAKLMPLSNFVSFIPELLVRSPKWRCKTKPRTTGIHQSKKPVGWCVGMAKKLLTQIPHWTL
jgi:rhodanese-related sulfurtransferase